MIRARELAFHYPSGRIALDGIDFDARSGEIVALVGPNGCGKSTLLRLLAGFLRPTSGALDFAGASRPDPDELGWAPDRAVHFDELTGRRNALVYARAHGTPPSSIDALFHRFGLEPDADVPVAEYSFGMRRKLLLIQAMAHSPKLLLLDEPTVGLDPDALTTLQSSIRERVSVGTCCVLATNDMAAGSAADRVLLLDRGRLIADGPPAELIASLNARTRVDIALDALPSDLPAVPEVRLQRTASGVTVETIDGAARLPTILAALIEAGLQPSEIRIRAPGLADVFRSLTGRDLIATARAEAPPAPSSRRGPPWRRRT